MRTVELDEAIDHPNLETNRAILQLVRALRQGQPGRAGGADAGEDDSSEQSS